MVLSQPIVKEYRDFDIEFYEVFKEW
ncbi:uncharacterized protein METZ01_LOCUS313746 [marine metagenome]|uniref:Uncharacterized protein n=1 Tax=marine metagenome TaxID=408172 RepID=A0A382NMF7_9ZZZZ